MKGDENNRIPSGLVVILVLVVRVIIGVVLLFLVLFPLLLETTTVLRLVNRPAWIMLSVNLTPMVSISIGFLGEFIILGMSLFPLGYCMAPDPTLSSTSTILPSISNCILEILYFSLQQKHCVL